MPKHAIPPAPAQPLEISEDVRALCKTDSDMAAIAKLLRIGCTIDLEHGPICHACSRRIPVVRLPNGAARLLVYQDDKTSMPNIIKLAGMGGGNGE